MNKPTKSEEIFEEFCATHGIACERLPTAAGRTPDYEITLGGRQVVVEIKQLNPNPEEKREIKELDAKGWIVGGKGPPGHRMRGCIDEANGQLRSRTKGILPSLLVVYENVPHTLHTAPYCILVAMYGLEQHLLDRAAPVRLAGKSFGGKRKMTPKSNTSTSAVAVPRSHGCAARTLDVYHNIHASVPLDPVVFAGTPVQQYTLPHPGVQQFQDWVLIGESS